jgi:hypothetical protein
VKNIEPLGFTRWLFVAILVLLCSVTSRAALIPPQFSDAVVALGSMQLRITPGQPCTVQWFTEGTGFLYGFLTKGDPDPIKRAYEVYLVTNRHVIEEHVASQSAAKAQHMQPIPGCPAPPLPDETSISVRLNPLGSSLEGRQFSLPIKDWFFHPNNDIDVAAVRLNTDVLKTQGLLGLFFQNDVYVANKNRLQTLSVSAGDGVFVLGFPMNLAGVQRNYVIVRQGCIARISDMLDGSSASYLLDAFIFPGNSGGPVILRPDLTFIEGTNAQRNAYLIGFVRSYQPYIDVAISPQTKHARISFEENSGLAEVLPTDTIDEAIVSWRSALPKS